MGGGWARWVMGSKEDTCWDEPWVSYVRDESLGSTPEANTTWYVNELEFKLKKKGKTDRNKQINK